MYGQMSAQGFSDAQTQGLCAKNLECAVALVNLGANCSVKVELPSFLTGKANNISRTMGLDNKTPTQLAALSGKRELIDAMSRVAESKENVHCRCGSRLPWKDCHSGAEDDATYFKDSGNLSDDTKVTLWRYSPLAKCPCNLTGKKYFKCCWKTSSRPHYQNDSTGELNTTMTVTMDRAAGAHLAARVDQWKREGSDPNTPLFPNAEENHARVVAFLRNGGHSLMSSKFGPKCKIGEWDPEVYAGTFDRIQDSFQWNDVHWDMAEPELLLRVKEWNAALQEYCSSVGLKGAEREAVVAKHTASPLAPCVNLTCTFIESRVKELKCCSRCKSVAYCSKACQAAHWKDHKSTVSQRTL
jgi:hypothetical protein